jgi:hypothetical protein
LPLFPPLWTVQDRTMDPSDCRVIV